MEDTYLAAKEEAEWRRRHLETGAPVLAILDALHRRVADWWAQKIDKAFVDNVEAAEE